MLISPLLFSIDPFINGGLSYFNANTTGWSLRVWFSINLPWEWLFPLSRDASFYAWAYLDLSMYKAPFLVLPKILIRWSVHTAFNFIRWRFTLTLLCIMLLLYVYITTCLIPNFMHMWLALIYLPDTSIIQAHHRSALFLVYIYMISVFHLCFSNCVYT